MKLHNYEKETIVIKKADLQNILFEMELLTSGLDTYAEHLDKTTVDGKPLCSLSFMKDRIRKYNEHIKEQMKKLNELL